MARTSLCTRIRIISKIVFPLANQEKSMDRIVFQRQLQSSCLKDVAPNSYRNLLVSVSRDFNLCSVKVLSHQLINCCICCHCDSFVLLLTEELRRSMSEDSLLRQSFSRYQSKVSQVLLCIFYTTELSILDSQAQSMVLFLL